MEELNAVQNEKLMDETIKHELERIKNLTPGSNEYNAAYECAAKFYEIRVTTRMQTRAVLRRTTIARTGWTGRTSPSIAMPMRMMF